MSFKSGFVSIIGRPNAGKSTILNAIIGEHLSIVTPKEQTTRGKICGIYNAADVQIVFIDTPGFHQSSKKINQYMVDLVRSSLEATDIILCVMDVTADNSEVEVFLQSSSGKPKIVFMNKLDLISQNEAESILKKYAALYPNHPIIPASAITGMGTQELLAEIRSQLPEGPAYFPTDEISSHTMRFLVRELIREQITLQCHQELPYAAAVRIEEFKEKPDIVVIKASIIIERHSQKKIIIGTEGGMIRSIGSAARKKIEQLLQQKVFLECHVVVDANWTQNMQKIREYLSEN